MTGLWDRIADRLSGRAPEQAPDQEVPKSAAAPRWIVGLDFGTSGSKVVIRDIERGGEAPMAVDFGTPPASGYSRFVFPSTIAVHKGRLLFGIDAEARSAEANRVFRSLKREYLRQSDRDGAKTGAVVAIQSDDMPEGGLTAIEFLITLFLAEVLRRVWQVMKEKYGEVPPDRIVVNLDIPVSASHERSHQRTQYLKMLRTARVMSNQLSSRPSLDVAQDLWNRSRTALGRLPPESERRESLVAEAVAAIGGLGEAVGRPRADNKLVAVDIGAGTTDIGFFVRPDRDLVRFYSATTHRVGCDDVDLEICTLLGCPRPTMDQLHAVRIAKARVEAADLPAFNGQRFSQDVVRAAINSLEEAIYQVWRAAFGEAYQKEKRQDRWHTLNVFLIGGGSLIRPFRILYERPPWNGIRRVRLRSIEQSIQLRSIGADARPPDEADLVFLLTALGLSLPPPDMPDLHHPADVDPVDLDPSDRPTGDFDWNADDYWGG